MQHPPALSRKLVFAVAAAVLSFTLCFAAGELLTRLCWKEKPSLEPDEKTLSYRYDPELGWFPKPNSSGRFFGSREFSFQHNRDGFRDVEHGPKVKPRIAFVGDSYVWGYDADAHERFTDKLQERVPDWEVVNLGISGYGTDQELLLAQKWLPVYRPDVVVLVFSDNDTLENTLNFRGGYYKPWFENSEDRLVLRGTPVPKCLRHYTVQHPFLFKSQLCQLLVQQFIKRRAPIHTSQSNPTLALILQFKAYSEAQGAKFILSFGDEFSGERKRSFAEKTKTPYFFLIDEPHLTTDYFYPTQGNHWTLKGQNLACDRLYEFLTTNQFLNLPPEKSSR